MPPPARTSAPAACAPGQPVERRAPALPGRGHRAGRPGRVRARQRRGDRHPARRQPARRAPVGRRGLRRPDARGSGGVPTRSPRPRRSRTKLQRRLGLDASLGLASSRLAARVASTLGTAARPAGRAAGLRGARFLARQPVSFLDDLPPHLASRARRMTGIATLGELAEARSGDAHRVRRQPPRPSGCVRPRTASRRAAHRGRGAAVMDPGGGRHPRSPHRPGRPARRVVGPRPSVRCRRLRPFDVRGRRGRGRSCGARKAPLRRDETFEPGIADEPTARAGRRARWRSRWSAPPRASALIQVRLSRLARRVPQASLFPTTAAR